MFRQSRRSRPSAEVIELNERALAILADLDPGDRWTEGGLPDDLDDRSAEIFAGAELIAEALGQWAGADLLPDEVAVNFVRAEVADLAAAVDGRDPAEWFLVGRMWVLLAWLDRIRNPDAEESDADEFFAALPEQAVSPWANFLYGAGLIWVLCLYFVVGLLAFAGASTIADGETDVSDVVWFVVGCAGANTIGLVIVLGWYRSYSGRWLPGSTIRW